jgi:dihydropteroate synthase
MADKPVYINIRGRLIDLSLPRVMGIINVTPDSFFSGSRAESENEIIENAGRMIEDGADFLDIGGWSSRPGAGEIPVELERARVITAVKAVSREFPEAAISVDTYRSEIAEEAVSEYGAGMINDITGGESDRNMFQTVSRLQVPYVIMHMQGLPSYMQENPSYENVASDIIKWFGERIVRLKSMGVTDIIIDPGFGFGKNASHNFQLLNSLSDFSITGLPVLVGVSRKSMVWKTLGISPEEALNGTTVLNTVALLAGADILRVHDVREAVQAVKLVQKLRNSSN